MSSTSLLLKRIAAISVGSLLWVSCASSGPTEPVSDTTASEAPAEAETASTEVATAELVPVKAGHLVALDMAPLFVGVESGCFEENGLAVETVAFTNPGDNNAALAGGSIDFR
ncbi:MAG: ABC transporter substrate-binding protein, partial [Leptolyngbya sp. SIO3F4]|nr:ABC transporter substrate-binding protein [Leptolyngbya sp. SIO3F4]